MKSVGLTGPALPGSALSSFRVRLPVQPRRDHVAVLHRLQRVILPVFVEPQNHPGVRGGRIARTSQST